MTLKRLNELMEYGIPLKYAYDYVMVVEVGAPKEWVANRRGIDANSIERNIKLAESTIDETETVHDLLQNGDRMGARQ